MLPEISKIMVSSEKVWAGEVDSEDPAEPYAVAFNNCSWSNLILQYLEIFNTYEETQVIPEVSQLIFTVEKLFTVSNQIANLIFFLRADIFNTPD